MNNPDSNLKKSEEENNSVMRLAYICTDPLGLHARPAGQFVKEVQTYASLVTVIKGEKMADASGILALLGLGIRKGDRFEITVEGPDQETAAAAADAFFKTIADRVIPEASEKAELKDQNISNPEKAGDGTCKSETSQRETNQSEISRIGGSLSEIITAGTMRTIRGYGVSDGIAIGPLYRYRKKQESVESGSMPGTGTDTVPCSEEIPSDKQQEWDRFLLAREEAVRRMHALELKMSEENLTDTALLLEAHQMIAKDRELEDSVKKKILMEGMRAEKAVWETFRELSSILASTDSDYLKAREADIIDVSERITDILTGSSQCEIDSDVPVILFADKLTPGEFAQMERHKIMGLVLSAGSALDHTAILARTMGIPAVFGVGGVFEAGEGAILDGDTGSVILNPDEETLAAWRKRLETQRVEEAELRKLKGKPAITKDGQQIQIFCNIQFPQEVSMVLENDAEGIGLFRSEFLFLGRKELPQEEEQYEAYRYVLEQMQGKVVTIRTIDVGADKNLEPGFVESRNMKCTIPAEACSVPEMCAPRTSLNRPELFHVQLRALYRASAYGNLRIMFPMITNVREVKEACRICDQVQSELAAEGVPYDSNVKLGIMIETPAAALTSDILAKEADFFSCGTNDLTQYTLACDRQDTQQSPYYDSHHPSVLRLLKTICDNAQLCGIPVGICGELAADPAMTEYFARIGIDELSVAPGSVLKLRRQIREVHLQ